MQPKPLTVTSQIKFLCGLWGLQKISAGYVFTPYIKNRHDGERNWTPRFWKYPLSEDDQSALEEFLRDHDRDDVYFSPTIYNRRRAEKTNAKMSRLLFADFDEVNPLEFGEVMQPHFVWETSPGSWQGVYVLAAPLEPEAFEHWNRKLTYHFGADKGCWPINHVIRIPGRRNYKPQNGPQGAPGRLWRQARGVVHLTSDEWKALPEVQETQAFTPDVLLPATGHDHSALVKSVKGKMPPSIWRWLTQMPDHDDRSTACHTLAKELFRAQLSADEVGAVLWLAPVFKEKYGSRIEPMSELKREVEKALQALLRDGWTYDEKAATVAEPEPEIEQATIYTDAANGARLIQMYGQDLHYVQNWKAWVIYNGSFWERDHTQRIREMAKEQARELLRQTAVDGNKSDIAAASKWVVKSLSAREVTATITSAASLPGVIVLPSDLDKDRWLFNLDGATIDLRTAKGREPNRDDLITCRSNVKWVPGAKCPTWEKAIAQWFPDPAIRAYVQRAIGYSLTGSLQEKCFFVLQGHTDAGKSVFMSTMSKLFGSYASSLKSETLEQQRYANRNTDDLADLLGKRWVSWSELTPGMKLNTRLVKEITGVVDADLKVMRKHETTFVYKPQFHIWIDTNDLPYIDHRDQAAFNRFKLVHFGDPLPKAKQDKELYLKLEAELPGIMQWAVRGLKSWLDLKGLAQPEVITEAVEEQQKSEDLFGTFLDSHYTRTGSAHYVVTNDLLAEYKDWAGLERLSGKAFGAILAQKGLSSTVARVEGKPVRVVKYIRPRD